ncbi:transmembrane gamma-carboxyglutamic acid protein 1 [Brienomyrus brachyistius]|uniref:transmembrane gamma-carboxyglutamic acid protein 1 n=1 Tax=Brienomyrus brachyistius TaxID=42636 RepID=UPI0020B3134B|nr:transmembrane gamma-carboxyglutamic acid protein 1 [Brienomyrus brachyistius]XP_048834075.1 transmembrane gamma-carboxyglutamic acid protein 1 [Brienomyrus brachyistius]XP_048834076.1 transmembrane gamma-carboxyglutamic acid protein 1 [Brienomyrus brachyistius]
MANVFLSAETANGLLRRLPRANSLLEEIKQGNIQRECREEICSYEEAREAFENDDKTRRFWEEYVRESNGPGGLDVSGIQSLYLILPLVVGLLLVVVVMVAVWKCQSRKHLQRGSAYGNSQRDPNLSHVNLDPHNRGYQPELSPNLAPPPGQSSVGDPPPSYEEAVGQSDVRVHVEPPPQYEDIVTRSSEIHVK